jgi:Cu/Ag efflux pump CusA
LTQLGFRAVEVLEAVNTAFQGTVVAQTYRGNQSISAAVILEASARQEPETIGALMLSNSQGERFRLSELADIYSATGRSSILHEGARRRQTVTCAASGRSTSAFVKDARQHVKNKISLPAGYYVSFTGTDEARRQAQHQLLLNSTIAAVGILLLLSMVLRHWQNLLLVLANIPFALAGGVLALWLHSLLTSNAAPLTLGSLVGFVTLFGLTTRNTIMMLSHFQHLVSEEGMTWGPEAALQGAGERLMPILITAIVTALGLLPLAFGSGEAGREIEGPMAIVILGGLTTSTLLNLLVLPTLSLRYGRFGTQATV